MASPAALAGTKPRITDKRLIQAAYSSGGIIRLVAEHFGVTRTAIYKRIESSAELRTAFECATEDTIDLAEAKHIEAIKAGYYPAIAFHLKTKGKRRGYSTFSQSDEEDNSQGFILKIQEVNSTRLHREHSLTIKENADMMNSELQALLDTSEEGL
jgi:hypothetical protein